MSFSSQNCCKGSRDISDNSSENVKVYPNPTSDVINIAITEVNSPTSLYIYNMSGKVIYSEQQINVDNNTDLIKQIDLSAYSNGVYFIKLTNNEMVKTIKFIISK